MKAAILKLTQVSEPIREMRTKFGGQPVWLEEPEWPISTSTGEPMTFFAQIELTKNIFPNAKGRMAYLFMNTDEDAETWDMDGGNNAVIIQPGNQLVETKNISEGIEIGHAYDSKYDKTKRPEFVAELSVIDEDPEPEDVNDLNEPKIGGTPHWVQYDEEPFDDQVLLFQIDENRMPLDLNFGLGVAYAFMNGEGTSAKFFWQC